MLKYESPLSSNEDAGGDLKFSLFFPRIRPTFYP